MKVFLEPVVRCFLDKILNKYFDYIEQIFITNKSLQNVREVTV